MNKAPVLPTRPALLFKDKQPKDDQVLPYTRQRREDHPTLIRPPTGPWWRRRRQRRRRWCYNDQNFVAQEQPTASCGLLCYVWHYTTPPTTARRWRRRRRSHCHRSRATLKSAMPQQIDHLLVNRCNETKAKGLPKEIQMILRLFLVITMYSHCYFTILNHRKRALSSFAIQHC